MLIVITNRISHILVQDQDFSPTPLSLYFFFISFFFMVLGSVDHYLSLVYAFRILFMCTVNVLPVAKFFTSQFGSLTDITIYGSK